MLLVVAPKLWKNRRSFLDPKYAYWALHPPLQPERMTDQQESKSRPKAGYPPYRPSSWKFSWNVRKSILILPVAKTLELHASISTSYISCWFIFFILFLCIIQWKMELVEVCWLGMQFHTNKLTIICNKMAWSLEQNDHFDHSRFASRNLGRKKENFHEKLLLCFRNSLLRLDPILQIHKIWWANETNWNVDSLCCLYLDCWQMFFSRLAYSFSKLFFFLLKDVGSERGFRNRG